VKWTARLLVVIVGAACTALPAAAQAPPPIHANANTDNGDTIVVTGRTSGPSKSEVYKQAQGISRVDPRHLYIEAMARFWAPLCPGVVGLQPEAAGVMIDRIRANAAELKVHLAGAECSPNLVVAFVDDGRSLLADLQRDRPQIFSLVSDEERSELLGHDEPVRVWNNVTVRWTGAGARPRDEKKASVWGQLDRSSMPESPDIVSALVVFDRTAVLGMTLGQLADYATMRGLSRTRPASGGQPMTTILSLFDNGGGGPDALTSFDVGYLQSLYWWRPNSSAADRLLGVQKRAARVDAAGKP
jgi:hypothetical protein